MLDLSPTNKLNARKVIANFCVRAEVSRLHWFYNEYRPFRGFAVPPESQHVNDCSGYCSLAFYWSVHHVNSWMADPLGENYTGYGNTGSALAFLRAHPVPSGRIYMVGDMAIFGSPSDTVHMIICRQNGTRTSAIWSSNGHQDIMFVKDAPEPISLAVAQTYQPLVGVYRHPALL